MPKKGTLHECKGVLQGCVGRAPIGIESHHGEGGWLHGTSGQLHRSIGAIAVGRLAGSWSSEDDGKETMAD